MIIEEYSFGSIVINGEKHNKDIEVRFEFDAGESKVDVLDWWRNEGHVFDISDLERAVQESPSVIILGNGAESLAQVPDRTIEMLNEQGIEVLVDATPRAVEKFEREVKKVKEKGEGKVFGLFHLTC